jgi:hypothetical protein
MNNLLKEKKGVGVIICRMQVPYLTESHTKLIQTVCERHKRVIIFLGTTNQIIDPKNPFPFEFRKQMILNTPCPDAFLQADTVSIVPLPDQDDNAQWVNNLDSMVKSFLAFDEEAILYGGRDSFIPWYKKDNGKFSCVELAPDDYDSGTELRNLTAIEQPKYSVEAASAILWTLRQMTK